MQTVVIHKPEDPKTLQQKITEVRENGGTILRIVPTHWKKVGTSEIIIGAQLTVEY